MKPKPLSCLAALVRFFHDQLAGLRQTPVPTSKPACRGLAKSHSNVIALVYAWGYSRLRTPTCEIFRLGLGSVLGLGLACTTRAATTIDPVNSYAYGANLGWINAAADGANGAVLGNYVCKGFLYSANVGWINLGSGAPANGIRYQNLTGSDFGVNNDGFGHLSGYAYGANLGWIKFEATGAPQVDLRTGILSGSVWSANCGWISLSNSVTYVQTDSFWPGLLDTNGLPYAWELVNFATTGIDPSADPDHDGRSNMQEYLAGTDPNNPGDYLRITGYAFGHYGITAALTWTSVSNRFYHIEEAPVLATGAGTWTESVLGLIAPDGSTTARVFSDASATNRFYRIRVSLPLGP